MHWFRTGLVAVAICASTTGVQAAERVVTYDCFDNNAIKVTFLEITPPSVVLARGEEEVMAEKVAAASGTRYEAEDGIVFWDKGAEALVDWDAKKGIICRPR